MELEFRGHYEKADYFKGIGWIFKPRRRDLIIRGILFLFFAVVYILHVYGVFKEGSFSAFAGTRMVRHLITFGILGYFLFQPYLKGHLTASKLWADPIVRREIKGRVSTIGIKLDPSEDWMTWDDFVKVYQSSDLVVLLTIASSFIILPQGFFRSTADWQMLRNLVSERVKEAIT